MMLCAGSWNWSNFSLLRLLKVSRCRRCHFGQTPLCKKGHFVQWWQQRILNECTHGAGYVHRVDLSVQPMWCRPFGFLLQMFSRLKRGIVDKPKSGDQICNYSWVPVNLNMDDSNSHLIWLISYFGNANLLSWSEIQIPKNFLLGISFSH